MHYILREVKPEDIHAIQELLTQAHKGITNLPYDTSSTHDQITRSIRSFTSSIDEIGHEFYLFVLEDLQTQKVIGVSAIKSLTGRSDTPSFFFRKSEEIRKATKSPLVRSLESISAISYFVGPSEVCSLFLDESMRGKGIGALLSLGRFLYMANHPARFTDHIIAELRGIIRSDGTSPFYDGIGKHFFKLPFMHMLKEASANPNIILELLPSTPIYLDLLPLQVREALGALHDQTKAAMKILSRIGFEPTNEFDIFDGGPKWAAEKLAIAPCKESFVQRVDGFFTSETRLAATQLPLRSAYISTVPPHSFRAMKTTSALSSDAKSDLYIAEKNAQALGIQLGDPVRIWFPLS